MKTSYLINYIARMLGTSFAVSDERANTLSIEGLYKAWGGWDICYPAGWSLLADEHEGKVYNLRIEFNGKDASVSIRAETHTCRFFIWVGEDIAFSFQYSASREDWFFLSPHGWMEGEAFKKLPTHPESLEFMARLNRKLGYSISDWLIEEGIPWDEAQVVFNVLAEADALIKA